MISLRNMFIQPSNNITQLVRLDWVLPNKAKTIGQARSGSRSSGITKLSNAVVVGVADVSSRALPSSSSCVSLGSSGIFPGTGERCFGMNGTKGVQVPKKGTRSSSASNCPPPEANMFVQSAQWGQTKPLMFSTIPRIGSPALTQKLASRRTSPIATF